MSMTVKCPSCDRQLRVPEDLMGKTVKCPSCCTMFVVEGGGQVVSQEGDEGAPQPGAGQHVVAENRRFAEKPPSRARSRPLRPPEEEEEDYEDEYEDMGGVRRDAAPHRGGLVLTLGIISLVSLITCVICFPITGVLMLGFGIPAWVMGHRDLKRIKENQMDPMGKGITQGGWICGIVGTSLGILFFLIGIIYVLFFGFSLLAGMKSAPPAPPPPPPVKRKVSVAALPERTRCQIIFSPALGPSFDKTDWRKMI